MTTETTTPPTAATIPVLSALTVQHPAPTPKKPKGTPGRPATGPQTDRLTVSLSPRLLVRFETYCAESGYSRSDAARQALESMLLARGY